MIVGPRLDSLLIDNDNERAGEREIDGQEVTRFILRQTDGNGKFFPPIVGGIHWRRTFHQLWSPVEFASCFTRQR
jgi:hypothetical protein